jgi:hypothetical protein
MLIFILCSCNRSIRLNKIFERGEKGNNINYLRLIRLIYIIFIMYLIESSSIYICHFCI